MTITDEATEDIDQAIAKPPPEREGLLFGPINRDIVILFVADNTAATTTATYQIYFSCAGNGEGCKARI
jgi:hypothetical protein